MPDDLSEEIEQILADQLRAGTRRTSWDTQSLQAIAGLWSALGIYRLVSAMSDVCEKLDGIERELRKIRRHLKNEDDDD